MRASSAPSTFLAAGTFALLLGAFGQASMASAQPILLGLDADMSLGSARAGEAIRRGIELAIDDINGRGGIIGRPFELLVKDHRGNPVRGEDNIREFAAMDNLLAVIGGLHTPVALHELKAVHETGVIYLGPWAAGTEIVDNGYQPNYVFRVSVRDEYAGGFLVRAALKRGHIRIALVLENTAWGRSNEKAMRQALKSQHLAPVSVSWFHWGTTDFLPLLDDLLRPLPDAILLVANAPEGLKIIQGLAQQPASSRVPLIAHWGITGGHFFKPAQPFLKNIKLEILQTYSFIRPRFPGRAAPVIDAYAKRYLSAGRAEDILSPSGTAHAYDLVHILALAIEKAGSTDRRRVRDALETLESYNGLVRNYNPPFTPTRHDALDEADFILTSYTDDGVLMPVE